MAKIHINSNGEPGVCKATTGACPFGSEDTHFSSKEEAAKAYSDAQGVLGNASFGQTADRPAGGVPATYYSIDEAMKVANILRNEGKTVAISSTIERFVDEDEIPDRDNFDDEDEYEEASAEFEASANNGEVTIVSSNSIYQVRAYDKPEDIAGTHADDWDAKKSGYHEVWLDEGATQAESSPDYDSMRLSISHVEVEILPPKS